ncbi:MAG: peptide/nickel transport system substrate-binding protein [Mesotoga sp.]|nr:peptide/nickel transport system substrate-binding protein [Mesotoga sp.]
MKKLFVCMLVLFFSGLSLAQISAEEAIPVIESRGILTSVDESPLTFTEFKAAIEKAFPGKEEIIKGKGEVSRADFAVAMVEVLGLQSEAEAFDEICTTALDEWEAPEEAWGALTVAYRSNRQLLDFRYGHVIEASSPITRKEAAISIYMAMNPPAKGGTATTAVTADAPGFNTLFTSAGLTWTICNIIGDGVTGTDKDGFYFPRMIKRMPSLENGLMVINEDGSLTITYELRKGMKWHDGEPVTAHDAKFQWEVMNSGAPVTTNYFESSVSEVEVIDDYTYSITLPEPLSNAELGSSVYAYYFGWFQLPEHVFRDSYEEAKHSGSWDSFVENATKNPIMTGPYKLKEYVEGQYVIMEAFDEYYMGRPNIDQLVMRIIPDMDVVFASTLNGEIDFGRYTLTLKQSVQLENERADMFNVFYTPNIAYDNLNLNLRDPEDTSKPHPIFGDKRVRQAVLYGLNREQISNVVYAGLAEVVDTWITDLHQMRDALKSPEVKHYEYNPAKAKALLEEAGWKLNSKGIYEKDGTPLKFSLSLASGSGDYQMMAQMIQGMLKQIGMEVEIEVMPALVIWTEIFPYGDFDAHISGWGYGVSDEAANYWTTDQIPSEENYWGGMNFTGWANAENDELVNAAARELDPEKKLALYEKHFALWTEELPVLPLVVAPTPHFAKKYIKSFNSGYDNGLGWIIQNWYIDEQ